MKIFLIILCIVLIIVPFIVWGCAIVNAVEFDSNCTGYLKLAADANTVQLAEKHLTSAITYLENNNLTSGYTKIIIYKPTNDIGLWYENLKSAQTLLQEACANDNLTELESSNILMKLRETLLDGEGTITHPICISMHPHSTALFWTNILICLLWVGAGFAGFGASEIDYRPRRSAYTSSGRHILY